MRKVFTYLLLLATLPAVAQEIAGRVLDEQKQSLPSVAVQVYQGNMLKGGAITDYDGHYTIKPLEPGYYNVLVLYAGYDSILVTGVVVRAGDRTTQNFFEKQHQPGQPTINIRAYKKPLVDSDPERRMICGGCGGREVPPTTNVADLVALQSGLYPPAQEISGRVLDDQKQPLPNARVQVYQGGILKGGTITDYDGNYSIKPPDPGYYYVLVLHTGYDSILISGVVAISGTTTTQNFNEGHPRGYVPPAVKTYKTPPVNNDKPAIHILTKEEMDAVRESSQSADIPHIPGPPPPHVMDSGLNLSGGRQDTSTKSQPAKAR